MSIAILKASRERPSRKSPAIASRGAKPGDRFAGGEADRVHDAVERPPGVADAFDGGLNFFVAAHVHLEDEIAAELFGKGVNSVAGTVSRIGEGELGPFTMASLGDAVGNGTVGKQPRNQNLLTSKKTHGQYSL